ncbi:hypothetical protein GN244_ATG07754 [Phytophthora infestans]|uniref:Uncharacterized protein n=1 Tax=Phytophthora infestans TaxID=4787 RepID=A0A833SEP1_PHYIN|nr:hypothetical protein GN244_ATG07754 [Phytophthora infestans]KAF4131670.1 hypothetical protein GN958_ATG19144 [Phytophthora infestans]
MVGTHEVLAPRLIRFQAFRDHHDRDQLRGNHDNSVDGDDVLETPFIFNKQAQCVLNWRCLCNATAAAEGGTGSA